MKPNITKPDTVAALDAAALALENLAREHAERGDVYGVWRLIGKANGIRNMARQINAGNV